jgi:hypothetical protein
MGNQHPTLNFSGGQSFGRELNRRPADRPMVMKCKSGVKTETFVSGIALWLEGFGD